MNNSVRFTMGLDATQVVSGEKVAINSVNNISKAMQEAFGAKLKQVISFTAIEEATRRTAEWAQEINQTSRALGITAEELQSLQLIASQTGTAQDKVTSMFENIKKAAEEALSGNGEMIASFQKLGVVLHQGETASQAFSDTMKALNRVGVNNPDRFLRLSAQKVTGMSENDVAAFLKGYNAVPGEGLQGKASGLAGTGGIATNANIEQIASIWADITTQLKQAGQLLAPVASLLLGVADVFIKAVAGIAEAFGGLFKIIQGLLTGSTEQIKTGAKMFFGIFLNGMIGLMKILPDIVGSLTTTLGKWVSKVPGMTKVGNALQNFGSNTAHGLDDIGKTMNEAYGLDKITAERGEAVGNVAAVVEGLGEEGLTHLGSRAAYAVGARKLGGKLWQRSVQRMTENTYARVGLTEGDVGFGPEGMTNARTGNPLTPQAKELIRQSQKIGADRLMAGELFSAAAMKNIGRQALVNAAISPNAPAVSGGADTHLLAQMSPFMRLQASGGSNLKIGGMFGAGEERIIKMTQRMIDLLGQIVTNTAPWNGNATRMSGQGGGVPLPVRQAGGI